MLRDPALLQFFANHSPNGLLERFLAFLYMLSKRVVRCAEVPVEVLVVAQLNVNRTCTRAATVPSAVVSACGTTPVMRGPLNRGKMTDEQRNGLRTALKEVHDKVHDLYPRGATAAQPAEQRLRNELLVVDLAIHLADEVIRAVSPSEQVLVERTANLLYGIRLIAPTHPIERAAEVLLDSIPRGSADSATRPTADTSACDQMLEWRG